MKIHENQPRFNFVYFCLTSSARSQSSLSHTAPALQGSHNASTATKELDDLMASLSDFKVKRKFANWKFSCVETRRFINQKWWKWKLMYREGAEGKKEKSSSIKSELMFYREKVFLCFLFSLAASQIFIYQFLRHLLVAGGKHGTKIAFTFVVYLFVHDSNRMFNTPD